MMLQECALQIGAKCMGRSFFCEQDFLEWPQNRKEIKTKTQHSVVRKANFHPIILSNTEFQSNWILIRNVDIQQNKY